MYSVTFKQLQAFVVLAHERNFGRTAERLHVTPPTITASIKTLENAVGLRFFDRSTRSVVLTTQAEQFLPIAERLLEDLARALGDLNALTERRTGSVIVAGATSFIANVLTPAVAELAVKHPYIKVRLIQEATQTVLRQVAESKADFGVTALNETVPELASMLLVADRFGVVCHRDHPLARKKAALDLEQVARYSVIGLSRAHGLQSAFEDNENIPAAFRSPSHEVSNVTLMEPFLERNIGIALLPALSARRIARDSIVFRPIRLSISRRLYLVVRRGRSLTPAAQSLTELMFDYLLRLRGDPMLQVPNTIAQCRAFVGATEAP
jgi:LysR family carnitine catabolism transcriptional activator